MRIVVGQPGQAMAFMGFKKDGGAVGFYDDDGNDITHVLRHCSGIKFTPKVGEVIEVALLFNHVELEISTLKEHVNAIVQMPPADAEFVETTGVGSVEGYREWRKAPKRDSWWSRLWKRLETATP